MSQQGIFSIAPDAQSDFQNGSSNGASTPQNVSPFAAVTSQNSDQNSPFAAAAVQDSPFQQVAKSAPAENRGGLPQPRPEGQPPASSVAAEPAEVSQPAARVNSFEQEANDNNGGPFQMNGFHEQNGSNIMEAAPAPPAMESSPFATVNNNQDDYEAAKAGLEPQQDFAAVQPRYQVAEPAAQAAPAPVAAQMPTSQPVPAAPLQAVAAPAPVAAQQAQSFSAPSSGSAGLQQLELRAIFGVNHILTQDEIIQRARTLPGIRNVAVVGANESNALSNFRQALQGMGLGNSHEMKLSSGGGSVDFLTEGDITVAVLHEGNYGPGVQETLIIVTREIGKLA